MLNKTFECIIRKKNIAGKICVKTHTNDRQEHGSLTILTNL